jgi:hypothetical protein
MSAIRRIRYYIRASRQDDIVGGYWITGDGHILHTDWINDIEHADIAAVHFESKTPLIDAYINGWVRVSWTLTDYTDSLAVNFKPPMPDKARQALLKQWLPLIKDKSKFEVDLMDIIGDRALPDSFREFRSPGQAMNYIKENW